MPVPDNYNPNDTKPDSKYLRAEDYPLDQKWRLSIEDVTLELMPARDGKPARNRLILFFAGRDKGLTLNATNQSFIEARLGTHPNDWIGATVLLHRTTTLYEKKTVAAFRLIEAKKGAARPTTRPVPPPEPVEVEPIDEGEAAQYDTDDTPF